jgi:hypothetical protein
MRNDETVVNEFCLATTVTSNKLSLAPPPPLRPNDELTIH